MIWTLNMTLMMTLMLTLMMTDGYIKSLKLISWFNKYNQARQYKNKIDKELMPMIWHPTRVWD